MLSSLNRGVKTQKYFVSSSNIFLDKKTLLKIWLNPFAPEPPVTARADPGPFYPL